MTTSAGEGYKPTKHVGVGGLVASLICGVVDFCGGWCSIVNGIEEGRVLFDNLTKTVAYTLTHLIPELMAVVINILFDIPPGMSSLMILSIDLLSEVSWLSYFAAVKGSFFHASPMMMALLRCHRLSPSLGSPLRVMSWSALQGIASSTALCGLPCYVSDVTFTITSGCTCV